MASTKVIIKFKHEEGKRYNVGNSSPSYIVATGNKLYHYFLVDSITGDVSSIKSAADLDYYRNVECCKIIDGDAPINKI